MLEIKAEELRAVVRATPGLLQDASFNIEARLAHQAIHLTEARCLVERFERHYTPMQRSWLDMSEVEITVLSRQCLDQRIPDKRTLIEEVTAGSAQQTSHQGKLAVHHCKCQTAPAIFRTLTDSEY